MSPNSISLFRSLYIVLVMLYTLTMCKEEFVNQFS